ncbi:uncharacterized protein B0I36DRAFT_336440 [Microdochium trichocladiopsis]|uniref:Uncharacterized protein n=1 Tax=Microdochium trichocladiopsis TaxID=1682393 RepID=A0A9P8XSQ4_9PEZI|nr:uncharacterized protein B0I36DRAFT_336440 [Microdochium trichocladiopsis]KAH7016035.1 hypothetical protein B0I36DRAFT_336440 [Microdochium trichocladiopsis]
MTNLSPKKRDQTKEIFNRTCKGGAKRFNKISKKYGARVYVQVCWRGRHYEYTSHDEPHWPRTKDDLEIIYPLTTQWTPQHSRNNLPLGSLPMCLSNLKATPASPGKPLESAGEQPMGPKLAEDGWTAKRLIA